MMGIGNRVALVTGGQRGLGRAFVRELLDRGAARVYATARTPTSESDPRIVPLPLDVTDDASVAALAERADDVDVVVNNAGIVIRAPLLGTSIDQMRETFETNVYGPLRIAQSFAPVLAARGGGALVDVHSVLSWGAGAGSYGVSKAALWSLTNSLRIELAAQNTHVVGVHLGYADTDMTAAVTADKLAPEVVARAVLDGLENGDTEILVDDVSRAFKKALSGPVEGLTVPLGR